MYLDLQHQEGQLNGEGKTQTSSLKEILTVETGVTRCDRVQAKGSPVAGSAFGY